MEVSWPCQPLPTIVLYPFLDFSHLHRIVLHPHLRLTLKNKFRRPPVRNALFVVCLSLFWTATAAAQAQQLIIDPNHSAVTFTVRHMGISNVTGRIPAVSGTIVYDPADPAKSSVDAVIKTASVDTGVGMRDNDLRSANYFDSSKFPEASFKSKRIEKRGDHLVAIGDFTLKGVTKEIELPFDLAKADTPRGPVYGFTTETTLNRKDYNVNGGGPVVGDNIKLEISVEARPSSH